MFLSSKRRDICHLHWGKRNYYYHHYWWTAEWRKKTPSRSGWGKQCFTENYFFRESLFFSSLFGFCWWLWNVLLFVLLLSVKLASSTHFVPKRLTLSFMHARNKRRKLFCVRLVYVYANMNHLNAQKKCFFVTLIIRHFPSSRSRTKCGDIFFRI